MPPTGPEWALVRVELREKEAPFYRGRYAAAKTTGAQTDKAHCIFCGATFVATAGLIRVHVARAEPPSNSSASAALPADVRAHTARRARCVAAAQKRVKPAPETVAATAEEKERREGRKVRRPARFDD